MTTECYLLSRVRFGLRAGSLSGFCVLCSGIIIFVFHILFLRNLFGRQNTPLNIPEAAVLKIIGTKAIPVCSVANTRSKKNHSNAGWQCSKETGYTLGVDIIFKSIKGSACFTCGGTLP